MTFKAIRYSNHAALRLRQRRITREEVRRIVTRGKREKVLTRTGREQRWKASDKIGKRTVNVIFIERATELEVVTVTSAR